MKKNLLSLVCALALMIMLFPTAQALEGDGARAADALASLGLVTGTVSGYAASAPATQEQAAVLLVRLLGAEQAAADETGRCGWQGIPAWAQSAVNYCALHDLLSAQEYTPGGTVSAELWCAMLLRALGYGDEIVAGAAHTAQRIGLIARIPTGALTRGDLFESALAALTFPIRDGGTPLDTLLVKGLCTADAADALDLRSGRLTARQAADRYLSAVLCLDLYTEEALGTGNASSNASAFLISADGLAITNYHSINGVVAGTATLVTGEELAIDSVLYYDADIDIAVIRISNRFGSGLVLPRFNCISLAGTAEVRTGDVVYAIGNPLGLGLSMSQGVVSSTSHKADLSSLPCIVSDATISRGSSGGVLLNEFGHAIAVTAGAYTYGNNMYVGVPVDPAMNVDSKATGISLKTLAQATAAEAN